MRWDQKVLRLFLVWTSWARQRSCSSFSATLATTTILRHLRIDVWCKCPELFLTELKWILNWTMHLLILNRKCTSFYCIFIAVLNKLKVCYVVAVGSSVSSRWCLTCFQNRTSRERSKQGRSTGSCVSLHKVTTLKGTVAGTVFACYRHSLGNYLIAPRIW